MGMFDDIVVGDRYGQVKLWECELHTYNQFDQVPDMCGPKVSYSVAMREGGYVNVHEGILLSWTDEPAYLPVFDKWGAIYDDEESRGVLGEEYR